MATVTGVLVKTGSFPNTIDVSWTLSGALGANEQVEVRRQESIYPRSNEGTLVFSTTNSNQLSFQDENLDDNIYYYYSVFVHDTVAGTYTDLGPNTRDFAISYQAWGEGQRLTDISSPGVIANGGLYRQIIDVIGNMQDYYTTQVCALGNFRRPDRIAENLLDFYSEMFGFPPERGFDLRVLRNLAQGLIAVYKKKGTCQGLVDFTKIFTTWDSICDDTVDLTFRTWDGDSQRHFSYLTGVGVSQAIDLNANFNPAIWTNGKFVDLEDDPFYTVLGNDNDTIFFENKTPPFQRLDGTDGEGLDAVTFQDTTQSWTTDQWKGHRLFIDSFSTTEYYVIVSNDADTLFLNPLFHNYDNDGLGERFQQVPIDEIATLPTSYRIEPEYYVQNGRHSLTYDNTVPDGFRGLTKDPAHFLFGGSRSLLSLGQFSDTTVILVVQGIANFVGRSTALTTTTLTDDDADFGPVDSLVGKKLNPNILQSIDFEIIANTSNSITVLGDLTSVAASGNNYYILGSEDAIKARRLREVIPQFIPYYADFFLFFEPL